MSFVILCDGQAIRAVTRLTGASKSTVIKLLVDFGKASVAYLDAKARNVKAKRIQIDEIWSFTYAKRKKCGDGKHCSGIADRRCADFTPLMRRFTRKTFLDNRTRIMQGCCPDSAART